MTRMPALFVGHGSPMNAIEDNAFRQAWAAAARAMPTPTAVLCISAHWETSGVAVSSSDRPETIHDFYGFPDELFAVEYPAPGDPDLCATLAALVKSAPVALDPDRGLDHGAWSVLRAMYPDADVPVVQLCLDTRRPAAFHYALGRELAALRERGRPDARQRQRRPQPRDDRLSPPRGLRLGRSVRRGGRKRILARDHAALVAYEALAPRRRSRFRRPSTTCRCSTSWLSRTTTNPQGSSTPIR